MAPKSRNPFQPIRAIPTKLNRQLLIQDTISQSQSLPTDQGNSDLARATSLPTDTASGSSQSLPTDQGNSDDEEAGFVRSSQYMSQSLPTDQGNSDEDLGE